MAYRHNDAYYKHKKRAHKLKKISIVVVSVAMIITTGVLLDVLITKLNKADQITTSVNVTSVQSANVAVYRTEYFQFQATEDWVAVANLSTDKKFVYIKNDGSLVSQRLIVYIDRNDIEKETDLKVTNVIRANYNGSGFDNIGGVSEHCDASWPEELVRNPSRITHENVSFVCAPSSKQYNVIVGEPGDDEEYEITRKDGRKYTMAILFSDLTAYPGPGDLPSILSGFTTL